MPNLNNLRILIADDHEVVRRGLRALLSSRPGWVVCGEARAGREVVALAAHHRPDIVVMDIRMPELNGLEATRQIRKALPQTQVLVLSLHYKRSACSTNRGRGCPRLRAEIRCRYRGLDCHRSSCPESSILYRKCCQNPKRWLQTRIDTNASDTSINHSLRESERLCNS
jgi:CheY-like chemotaxis protein